MCSILYSSPRGVFRLFPSEAHIGYITLCIYGVLVQRVSQCHSSSGPSIVPVAVIVQVSCYSYSACEFAWRRWETTSSGSLRSSVGHRYKAGNSLYSAHTVAIEAPLLYLEAMWSTLVVPAESSVKQSKPSKQHIAFPAGRFPLS